MKYFLGIPAPDELTKRIYDFAESWKDDSMPLRLQQFTEPHVTVVPPFKTERTDWIEPLRELVSHERAPRFDFPACKTFGNSVLYVAISKEEEFFHLREKITVLLRQAYNLHFATRLFPSYHPHITVGKMTTRLPTVAKEELAALAEEQLLPAPDFVASSLRVYAKEHEQDRYHTAADLLFRS